MELRKRKLPIVQPDDDVPEVVTQTSYKCAKCDKVYSRNDTLQTHLKSVHGKSSIKCLVCSRTFSSSSALKRHELTHNEERAHQCQLCPKNFKRDDALTNHMCTVHNWKLRAPRKEGDSNMEEIVFNSRCEYCVEKKCLRHHLISTMHKGKPCIRHQCVICLKVLDTHGTSWVHEHFYHSKTEVPKDKGYQCKRCQRIFTSHKTLQQHRSHPCFELDSSKPLFDCRKIEDKMEAWRKSFAATHTVPSS